MKRASSTTTNGIRPLWLVVAFALAYCLWLGIHWLPLGYSDRELAGSAARVWDVGQQLAAGQGLPWWTPNFMGGSSYALNHSRGFYLVPWLLLSSVFSLDVAGKLLALLAIFASAIAMYFCARHFLRHDGAALLAAMAYMLCPEQLTRAATQEHMTISMFMPFVPLVWWLLARALERGRFRDIFCCAVVMVVALWTDYKQIFVQGLFLLGYLIWWAAQPVRRQHWQLIARRVLVLAVSCLALGAGILMPSLVESKHVKLFAGDPLEAWQRTYSFRSLLALVDRDGIATRSAVEGVIHHAKAGGYRPNTAARDQELRQQIARVTSLQMDSPEKYAGLVLLGLIVAVGLANRRRTNRGLLGFCLIGIMASLALGTGLSSIWTANLETFSALLLLDGVPGWVKFAVLLTIAAVITGCVILARRKLRTPRARWMAGIGLALFLFVPVFGLLANLPVFREIRAPGVFYSLPFFFLGALVAGFFVVDVLPQERSVLAPVTALSVLFLIDYWPYQRAFHANAVAPSVLRNLESSYRALRQDPVWGKTYSISGRYFHLLGPMYSGRPQIYEAFYNWMAPLGTGLLNQQAFSSWDNHRAFLNLMGARYIVYDKTDPANQGNKQLEAMYRQSYPVELENEDFVIWRNESAHAYVVAYERAALFTGDLRDSPPLALALAAADWPLVHASSSTTGNFERVYQTSRAAAPPITQSKRVPLQDLQISRPNHGLIRIKATAPVACTLVITESHYPFWRATHNGQSIEIKRISSALMGLELPAGALELTLQYQTPSSYKAAGALSALGLIVALVLVISPRSRQSSRARAQLMPQ